MSINRIISQFFSFVNSLGTSGWAVVAVVLVTVGVICMRGYGSRDNY